ncbi:MAG: dihydroneopterin aldolase [Sporomusaceae bacterium]|nr:dihydroneopterin aldolase [Sporomusaceae bacterium]
MEYLDRISLKDMMFYGFHGVYEYEQEQGQKFYVDVDMFLDLQTAGNTDSLEDTVDYTVIYDHVKEIMENHRFKLLEALGAHIGDEILRVTSLPLQFVTIRIRKPAVPLPGQIDSMEVQITRRAKL